MKKPLFVLDDQCHYFNFELGKASWGGQQFVRFVKQFRTRWAGTMVSMGKQTAEEFMELVFTQSATTVAGLNALGLRDLFGGSMVGDVEDHAKLAKKFPDRVILYGYVNPLDGKKALEQMEHQVNDLGAKAFKLYPIDPHGSATGWLCSDPKYAYPVFEKAAELGIKMIAVHKGIGATAGPHKGVLKYLDPDDMEDAAQNFPEIIFHCYHMAYPEVEKIAGLCALYDNMYVDMGVPINTACALQPLWFEDMMKKFLTMAPATKMTWGTDQIVSPLAQESIESFWNWQIPKAWEKGYRIEPLSEEVKRKILGETMAGLLDIDVEKTLQRVKRDQFSRRMNPNVKKFLTRVAAGG